MEKKLENNFGWRLKESGALTVVSRGHRFKVRYGFSVHFLVNILANILFCVSWYLRKMTLGVTDSMFGNYRTMPI